MADKNPFSDPSFGASPGAAKTTTKANPFEDPEFGKGGTGTDLLKSAKVGVQQLPGLATGIADLVPAAVAGVRPFTAAADAVGEATGFQPGKWAKETKFSQGYEQSKEEVDNAWKGAEAAVNDPALGFTAKAKRVAGELPGIAKAYATNPAYTANQVVESMPSMVAGGFASKGAMVAGRVAGVAADAAAGTAAKAAVPGVLERVVGEKLAAPIAGAAGEGLVTAGQQMDQYEGEDQQKNALASLGAGLGTAAIGAGAGRLANKMGLETAETAMAKIGDGAQALAGTAVPLSAKRRILGGIVSEAVLQELPQSMQEQMWQNYADGKPVWDGVLRAGAEGALAGGVMGGAANIRGGVQPEAAPGALAVPEVPAGMALADGWTPEAPAAGGIPPVEPGANYDTNGMRLSPITEAPPESIPFENVTPEGPTGPGMRVDTSALSLADAAGANEGPVPALREFDTGTLGLAEPTAAPRQMTRSESMGIDPNAGPLSTAAALAVDGGAHDVALTQAAAQAETEAQEKGGKGKGASAAPAAPLQTADPARGVFPTYEAADAYRRAQKVNGGTVKGLPVPVEGGFSLAMPGTPEYATGEQLRDQRRAAQSKAPNVKNAAPGATPPAAKAPRAKAPPAPGGNAAAAEGLPAAGAPALEAAGVALAPARSAAPTAEELAERIRYQRSVKSDLAFPYPIAEDVAPINDRSEWLPVEEMEPAKAAIVKELRAGKKLGDLGITFGADDHEFTINRHGKAITWIGRGLTEQIIANDGAVTEEDILRALDPKGKRSKATTALPPAGDIKAITAKKIPDMTDAELVQAAEHHGPKHVRTKKLRKEIERRAAAAPQAQAITAAAHEAATSPINDTPAPTEAQKEAGNYRKGHVSVNGLDTSIENPAGSQRSPEWPPLANHYGYFKGTVGNDKDHVDVFLTDRAHDASLPVFVVDQHNDAGFDEHKVVMGATDEADARQVYQSNYSKDWKGLGAITQMSLDEFKAWVRDPAKTTRPAAITTENPNGTQADQAQQAEAQRPEAPAAEPVTEVAPAPRGVLAKLKAKKASAKPALAGQLTVTFGGKSYPVDSIADARAKWEDFRDKSGAGVSQIGNGVEIKQGADVVARISYNGRVWDAQGKEIADLPAPPASAPVAQVTENKAPAAAPTPLYSQRKLTPGAVQRITEWAKSQGFGNVADDLHVTLGFSRDPVDASAVPIAKPTTIQPSTARSVERLGGEGAVVLMVESKTLDADHQALRDAGASWDFPSYQPHITITYEPGSVDLSKVQPFDGPIDLMAEERSPLELDKPTTEAAPAQAIDVQAQLDAMMAPDSTASEVRVPEGVEIPDAIFRAQTNRRADPGYSMSMDKATGETVFRKNAAAPTGKTPKGPAAATAPTAPSKRETKAQREDREAEEARAKYFTPGNVIRSYGGFDRVISYTPAAEAGGRWSVKVQEVVERDGKWVDSERSLERNHSTQPSPAELRNGPRAKIAEPILNSEEQRRAERRAAREQEDMEAAKEELARATKLDGSIVVRDGGVFRRVLSDRLGGTSPKGIDPVFEFPGLNKMIWEKREADANAPYAKTLIDRARAEGKDVEGAPGPAAEALPVSERSPARGEVQEKSGDKTDRIEDFGEELAGARKMTYTAAYKDKFDAAVELDVSAEPLSKTWPEPDYQKLIDAGADPWAVAIARAARDEVPTKPSKGWKLKGWAEKVKSLRDLAQQILGDETQRARMKARLAAGEFATLQKWADGKVAMYEALGHAHSLKKYELSAGSYSMHAGISYNPAKTFWTVSEKTAGRTWGKELAIGETMQEALDAFVVKAPSLFESAAKPKGTTFEIYAKRGVKENAVYIGKKIGRNVITIKDGFGTVKEARAFMADSSAELEATLAKMKDIPPERNPVDQPRVGADHRQNGDVSPEQFSEAFGFRGVQFGNYVEGDRRQRDLNRAYDALMDLAAMIDIPPRALSLNGSLGLAFGARGKGGKGAFAAHYEPGRIVINLTKNAGAGSLAHEWWHALDNYFGRQDGRPGSYPSESPDGDGAMRAEMREAFRGVQRTLQSVPMKARAKKLDEMRSTPYWSTGLEMSARAFEGYVVAKLNDQGARNDFLANIVSEPDYALEGGYPYPVAAEMPQVRAAFDHFLATIEHRPGEDGNVVLFSRGKDAGGLSPAGVKHVVDTLVSRWSNPPPVVIAQSMSDPQVPEAVRAHDAGQNAQGAEGDPEGFFYKGTVYILADKMNSEQDVARVLFHEALGHFGLRGAFGAELKPILQQLATMRRADVAAKAREYGLDMQNDRERLAAAEEVLAEMAQTMPENGFVRRAVAAIRTWLRTNVPVFKTLALSDAEIIRNYILPARRFVEQGGPTSAGRLDTSFSRSPMKSVESNIVRGTEAMARALTDRTSVHRAMFRNGLGWVDFVWGDGKKGLQHIIERRVSADGMDRSGVERMLSERVVGAIAKGAEVRRSEIGGNVRIAIEHEGHEAVLVRQRGGNGWLLTAFEKMPDAKTGSATRLSATQDAPIRSRGDLGAGDSIIDAKGDPDKTAPMFSRSTVAEYTRKAVDSLNQTLSAPGKLSWWHKTIGTMYNLAERSPAFKPVFDAAQGFVDDVSYYATDAADLAPKLLPKLEQWKDVTKSPVAAADNKAIAKPIFEGTLTWARDDHGKPVLLSVLQEQASKMTAEQKAQRMLAVGKMQPGMLKAWQALPLAQYEASVESRYTTQMLGAGIVWTEDELKTQFNLTPEQIKLYGEFREATDRSLDTMARADMLRFGGEDVKGLRDSVMDANDVQEAAVMLRDYLASLAQQDPERSAQLMALANGMIDRADKVKSLQDKGYAPLSRFGKYTVDVVVDGERQYFSLFETAREANQMAARMRQEFGKDNVSQGTISDEKFKMFAGITPESLELFGSMLGLDNTGDTAQDQAFQEYLRLTKSNRSAMKRLIHRQGIAGFSEDVGRVLAAFVYSNARQTAGGLHMGDLGEAITAIPKEQGELADAAMRLADYVKNPQEEGHVVRGLLFSQYLGGSIASAFVNMTQPVAVTFPWLSQFGGARQSAAQLARAAKQLASRGTVYEDDLKLALKHAEDDGTVSPQEVHQLMAQAQGSGTLRSGDGTRMGDARATASNALSRLALGWGKVFGMAEQVNRRVTFIAAYRIAKAQKMADPAEFAKKAVTETQFLYSKANKMRFARGAVGGTLMTFKTYSVAYLELLHRMWTQGGKDGKYAVMLALGVMLLMSGAGGLPFSDDLDDVADGLGQLMGYNLNSKKAKQEFLEGLFGPVAAGFIDRGITGLPGAPLDVSGRLGMGNLIPGTGLFQEKTNHTRDVLEIAGPAGDFAGRIFSGTRNVLAGNVGAGLMEMSPKAVQNAAKGVDMAARGMYRDAKGYKVLETNQLEAALKAIGFQPASVSKIQEANADAMQAKGFYSLRAQEIRAQWARGIFEQDAGMVADARAAVADWNQKNPDQPMRIDMPSVLKRVKEMRKPKDERIADTAPKAMRAIIREDMAKARGEL